jgi:hypothetical protein
MFSGQRFAILVMFFFLSFELPKEPIEKDVLVSFL